jgi:hypothetical protein
MVRSRSLSIAPLPIVVGVLAASISCGDQLLSAAAYDTPLLALTGYLQPFPVADLTSPRVTVVWVDPAGLVPDVPERPQAIRFALDAAGGFDLQLFEPPPLAAGVGTFSPGGQGQVRYAFGEVVVYDDLDGDGALAISAADDRLVGPDDYRGANATYVLVYIESTNAEGAPALPLPILAGPPGYGLGAVNCNTFGPPLVTRVDTSAAVLAMQIVPPSSQLPYVRTCLQSHPLGGS